MKSLEPGEFSQSLQYKHKDLHLILRTHVDKLGMAVNTCNLNTGNREIGRVQELAG